MTVCSFRIVRVFVASFLLAGAGLSLAQTDDLMLREIDQALAATEWQVGAFRLTPQLRVGVGYDSNAFSSSEFPVEDVSFLLGPGLRAVVPMGDRGLLDVYQELDFVYFRDLEQLRDVFNVTRVGGAVGGRDFVLRGNGSLETGKVRPSSEVDVPLDRELTRVEVDLDVSIGAQQELTLRYQHARFLHQDPIADEFDSSVKNLLDRSEQGARLGVVKHLTSTTSAVVEGLFDVIDYFDDSAARDGTGYGAQAGFLFSPTGGVRGKALFGYKRLVPQIGTQADYAGFIGSADVIAPVGHLFRVRALYGRDTRPSVLGNNWFFVENRFGGSVDFYLRERFYIRPGVVVGQNTYPRPTHFINEDGQEVLETVTDKFQLYSFSFNYEIRPDLVARVGGNYQIRDSNFPRFNKDRFVLTIGLTTDF